MSGFAAHQGLTPIQRDRFTKPALGRAQGGHRTAAPATNLPVADGPSVGLAAANTAAATVGGLGVDLAGKKQAAGQQMAELANLQRSHLQVADTLRPSAGSNRGQAKANQPLVSTEAPSARYLAQHPNGGVAKRLVSALRKQTVSPEEAKAAAQPQIKQVYDRVHQRRKQIVIATHFQKHDVVEAMNAEFHRQHPYSQRTMKAMVWTADGRWQRTEVHTPDYSLFRQRWNAQHGNPVAALDHRQHVAIKRAESIAAARRFQINQPVVQARGQAMQVEHERSVLRRQGAGELQASRSLRLGAGAAAGASLLMNAVSFVQASNDHAKAAYGAAIAGDALVVGAAIAGRGMGRVGVIGGTIAAVGSVAGHFLN